MASKQAVAQAINRMVVAKMRFAPQDAKAIAATKAVFEGALGELDDVQLEAAVVVVMRTQRDFPCPADLITAAPSKPLPPMLRPSDEEKELSRQDFAAQLERLKGEMKARGLL